MPKVVVIGGGWAGCASAISAKKAGAEVVILEKTDLLLGLGNVGGIMRNNGRYTATEEAIALGAKELFEITDKHCTHENMDFPGHNHATIYNVTKIESPVRQKIRDMGIEVKFFSRVVDVEMDDKMQPKNVNALVSLGTDDPGGLVAMVGMMSPAMMGFKVPDDGSTVQLPAGAIPSKGKPVPPIFLSRTENSLNIMVGDDKPAMTDYKADVAQISFSGMDGERYLEKFASIMKSLPNMSKDQDELKMLEAAGGMSGKVLSETSADKRGLVVNYHLQYE